MCSQEKKYYLCMVLICISLISSQTEYISYVHLSNGFSGSVVQCTIRKRWKNLTCVAVHKTHWLGRCLGLRVRPPLVTVFPWDVLRCQHLMCQCIFKASESACRGLSSEPGCLSCCFGSFRLFPCVKWGGWPLWPLSPFVKKEKKKKSRVCTPWP